MKRIIVLAFLVTAFTSAAFAQTRMDLSLYTSTRGEMQFNFRPQWQFPFLQGEHPLIADNNVKLKLDAALSPIWTGLIADAELTVLPFLSFTAGAMAGTGWNYDLFGRVPLVGLGLNKRTGIDDQNDGVIGNGLDGAVWNVHAGAMLQFDLAAFFPGDWKHVVAQVYNEIQYLAYTKAQGDDFWYYLGDNGINQNAFRHKFTGFVGYAMPIFIDLVGVQVEGKLPFYNSEAGSAVRDRGYSFDNSFIVNFRIHKRFSIMTITIFSNGFKDPITSDYEREWGFDRVQFIATWRIK